MSWWPPRRVLGCRAPPGPNDAARERCAPRRFDLTSQPAPPWPNGLHARLPRLPQVCCRGRQSHLPGSGWKASHCGPRSHAPASCGVSVRRPGSPRTTHPQAAACLGLGAAPPSGILLAFLPLPGSHWPGGDPTLGPFCGERAGGKSRCTDLVSLPSPAPRLSQSPGLHPGEGHPLSEATPSSCLRPHRGRPGPWRAGPGCAPLPASVRF